MRVWIAIRVFFVALFNAEVARQVGEILDRRRLPPPEESGQAEGKKPPEPKKVEPKKPPAPIRSDAVTLLSTLQREARFVDFVKEPLDGYSDAQIGAVARDVHRDCGKVLDRLLAVCPVVQEEEGAAVDIPAGFDAGRYHLTGNVVGDPPFHGRLVHHGWEATKLELPAWSGSESATRVVAPVEVELK
jgi:hypothetical protein